MTGFVLILLQQAITCPIPIMHFLVHNILYTLHVSFHFQPSNLNTEIRYTILSRRTIIQGIDSELFAVRTASSNYINLGVIVRIVHTCIRTNNVTAVCVSTNCVDEIWHESRTPQDRRVRLFRTTPRNGFMSKLFVLQNCLNIEK